MSLERIGRLPIDFFSRFPASHSISSTLYGLSAFRWGGRKAPRRRREVHVDEGMSVRPALGLAILRLCQWHGAWRWPLKVES